MKEELRFEIWPNLHLKYPPRGQISYPNTILKSIGNRQYLVMALGRYLELQWPKQLHVALPNDHIYQVYFKIRQITSAGRRHVLIYMVSYTFSGNNHGGVNSMLRTVGPHGTIQVGVFSIQENLYRENAYYYCAP